MFIVTTILVCDGCDNMAAPATSYSSRKKAVWTGARASGWIKIDKQHYCNDCRKERLKTQGGRANG